MDATGTADYVLPVEEMPGQLVGFARHPFASRQPNSDAHIPEGSGQLERICVRLKLGEKTFAVSALALRGADGPQVLTYFQDITSQKLAEIAFEKERDRLANVISGSHGVCYQTFIAWQRKRWELPSIPATPSGPAFAPPNFPKISFHSPPESLPCRLNRWHTTPQHARPVKPQCGRKTASGGSRRTAAFIR